jgi:DNA-binding NarL/FixJ family response regulator
MAAVITKSIVCILLYFYVVAAFSGGRTTTRCPSNSVTAVNNYNNDNKSTTKSRWILLVEDEFDLRKAIGKLLAKEGHQVTGVSDARSAIMVCKGIVRPDSSRSRFKFDPNYSINNTTMSKSNDSTEIPDCIISDIQLIGSMDGLGLLNFIRSDPTTASIPFLLLTAKGKVEDRVKGYESGADAYLPKPFDPDELLSIVNGLLRRDKEMSINGDANAPLSSSLTKNNSVYNELIHELLEIKTLLRLDNPSSITSDMTLGSLRHDILEIKEAIKNNSKQTSQSSKYGHDRSHYQTLSILTPVETEVMNRVSRGLTNKDIANELQCSISKIEKDITVMFRKANVNNRADLVSWWEEYSKTIGSMGGVVVASDSKLAKASSDEASNTLTAEERAVLELLERGMTTNEIIAATKSTKRALADQLDSLFMKTKVKTRTELVAWWKRQERMQKSGPL